ncbi:MAG: LytTR family DNA-binding domain-containing protein, partial [Myxococcota bacterium]
MSRRRFEIAAWVAFIFLGNAIDATSVLMEYARDGRTIALWEPLTWEFSSGVFTLLTIPLILAVESRVPITLETWKRAVPVHLLATVPVSLVHVTGMVGLRKAIYALHGRSYDFGNIPVELVYEWRKDAFSYFVVLFVVNAYRIYRERSEGEANYVDRRASDPLSSVPHFRVTYNRRDFNLDPADVEWIESAGNYVVLHSGERTYLMRDTMKNIEERLAGTRFRRVHRTKIVNLHHVEGIEAQD